jgi:hypothetical protein
MNAPTPNLPTTELQQQAANDVELSGKMLAIVQATPITTPEQYTEAGEELKEIKGELKRVTALRDEAIKPLQAVVTTIKSWFAPALSRLEEAEQTRKRQVSTYLEAKAAAENQARLALQDAVMSDGPDAGQAGANALAALTVAAESAPKVAGVSSSKIWDFEITDINAIPREFLMVNEPAIRAFIKAAKRPDAIPGVRAFEKISIRAGSK